MLDSYVWQEKYHIAQNYLLPAERIKTGVTASAAVIQPDAIRALIRWYCREAGVRNLQKHVEKLLRKVALKLARGTTELITITEKNLSDFVGKPIYTSDRMYERPPAGVVMVSCVIIIFADSGHHTLTIHRLYTRAWRGAPMVVAHYTLNQQYLITSNVQGPRVALLVVLVVVVCHLADLSFPPINTSDVISLVVIAEGLRITGQMGDVMQESSNIAYTVAKHMVHSFPFICVMYINIECMSMCMV
jgi:ATP-dependent Lon protease